MGKRGGKPQAPLRFTVGTHVICNTAEGKCPGRIVALHYREDHFPPGFVAPYQVQLDNGDLIFVPADEDELCSLRIFTWWEKLFETLPTPSAFMRRRAKEPDFGILELREAGRGQDIDQCNIEGRTALFESLRCRWGAGLQVLLEMGASPNVIDCNRRSPLHYAVVSEGPDTVHLTLQDLLSARADPNLQDKDTEKDQDFSSVSFQEKEEHRTPLHYCAEQGNDYVNGAATLLKAAADPNIIDAQYKTPLHLAIDEHGPGAMVTLLLQSRADPDKGNMEMGMTSSCLMVAARTGNVELAKELIEAGASLDKVGKQGMTALHMAARCRHQNVAELLIEAKCDANIKAMGKTAMEFADKNDMVELAKLLGSKMSDDQMPKLYLH